VRIRDADAHELLELHSFRELMSDQADVIADGWVLGGVRGTERRAPESRIKTVLKPRRRLRQASLQTDACTCARPIRADLSNRAGDVPRGYIHGGDLRSIKQAQYQSLPRHGDIEI